MSDQTQLDGRTIRLPRGIALFLVATCTLALVASTTHAIPAAPRPMIWADEHSDTKPLEDDYVQAPKGAPAPPSRSLRAEPVPNVNVSMTHRTTILRLFVLRTLFNIFPR